MVSEQAGEFGSAQFRAAMSRFATGITVVTTRHGDARHGITVNAFCSVSLDPPLVLICIERSAHAHDLIRDSGVYAVNILADDQRALSERCARTWKPGTDVLADIDHREGAHRLALIDGCLAHIVCRVERTLDGGDHSIFLGAVESLSVGQGGAAPILYFNSGYHALAAASLARDAAPGPNPNHKDGARARDPLRPR